MVTVIINWDPNAIALFCAGVGLLLLGFCVGFWSAQASKGQPLTNPLMSPPEAVAGHFCQCGRAAVGYRQHDGSWKCQRCKTR